MTTSRPATRVVRAVTGTIDHEDVMRAYDWHKALPDQFRDDDMDYDGVGNGAYRSLEQFESELSAACTAAEPWMGAAREITSRGDRRAGARRTTTGKHPGRSRALATL